MTLTSEMEYRECVRRTFFLHEAAFPVYKTFDGKNLTNLKHPSQLSREDLESEISIGEKGKLVLYGPVGSRKTHMDIAIGTPEKVLRTILTKVQIAAAMIEGLTLHGHIMRFEGERYRMKNALMRQKAQINVTTY